MPLFSMLLTFPLLFKTRSLLDVGQRVGLLISLLFPCSIQTTHVESTYTKGDKDVVYFLFPRQGRVISAGKRKEGRSRRPVMNKTVKQPYDEKRKENNTKRTNLDLLHKGVMLLLRDTLFLSFQSCPFPFSVLSCPILQYSA